MLTYPYSHYSPKKKEPTGGYFSSFRLQLLNQEFRALVRLFIIIIIIMIILFLRRPSYGEQCARARAPYIITCNYSYSICFTIKTHFYASFAIQPSSPPIIIQLLFWHSPRVGNWSPFFFFPTEGTKYPSDSRDTRAWHGAHGHGHKIT